MTVMPPEPWQQAFVDQLNAASRDHRADLPAAQQEHRCVGPPVGCGRPLAPTIASHFRDQASRAEYDVSGMCQSCQDATFPQPTAEEIAAMAADPDHYGRCGACGEYRELEFVDVGVGVISGFDCCRWEDVKDLPRCSAKNDAGHPCSLGADHAHDCSYWPPPEERQKRGEA